MLQRFYRSKLAWLGVGLIGGLILGGLWPHTPLHAVASDRSQSFAIASGPVDEEVEAVYFLDFLTGDLNAVVLNRQLNGFTGFYRYNVLNDLEIDPSKNPQYMMVTGMTSPRGTTGRMRPSLASVYVAEVTGGWVAAYAIPWSKSARAAGQNMGVAALVPLAKTRFRAAAAVGVTAPGPP